jgi:hypothetical protein
MKHHKVKIVILVLCAIFFGVQFIPVTRDNPKVVADFGENQEVKTIFKRSCYDCHSYETVWPWYSRIAPVSWLVAGDVHEAREELNFSAWGSLTEAKRRHLREGIPEEVEEGEMPLGIYLVMHSEAELSDADKSLIERWAAGRADEGDPPSSESVGEED